MALPIGEQYILNYTALDQRLENLQNTILSKLGTLCEHEVYQILSKELEGISTELDGFNQAAGEIDPTHPDAYARDFIQQNYPTSSENWRQARDLLGRLDIAPQTEESLRATEIATRALELQLPPRERAEKLLKDLTTLRENIDKGLIDDPQWLKVDDETTLISFYGNQLKEIMVAVNQLRNPQREKGIKALLQASAKILDIVNKYYIQISSPTKEDGDGKTREKKVKETKSKEVEKSKKTSKTALSQQDTAAIHLLEKLKGYIKSHKLDKTEAALQKLSSQYPKVAGQIFGHFYQIHKKNDLIKKHDKHYGRLVFTGEDTSFCRSKALPNLDKHRLEAVRTTITDLAKGKQK